MDVKCGVFYFPEHSKVLIALGKFKVNRPIYYYFISANSHALFPICTITYVKIGRNKYLRKNSNVCIYEPWCLLLIATYLTEVQKFNNQLHNLGKSNYLFIIVHYLLHLISVFLTSIKITALHENNVSHSYMFVRV